MTAQELSPQSPRSPDAPTTDIPEWVSEFRRLYVEPKRRVDIKQSGGLRRGPVGPLAQHPAAPATAEPPSVENSEDEVAALPRAPHHPPVVPPTRPPPLTLEQMAAGQVTPERPAPLTASDPAVPSAPAPGLGEPSRRSDRHRRPRGVDRSSRRAAVRPATGDHPGGGVQESVVPGAQSTVVAAGPSAALEGPPVTQHEQSPTRSHLREAARQGDFARRARRRRAVLVAVLVLVVAVATTWWMLSGTGSEAAALDGAFGQASGLIGSGPQGSGSG